MHTRTLLVDPGGLDHLRSLELVSHEWDVNVHVIHGPLLLHLEGGVWTRQGTGKLVWQLWQDAADEPLPGLAQHVHEEILGEEGVKMRLK